VVTVTVEGAPSAEVEMTAASLVDETSVTEVLLVLFLGAAIALPAKSTARRALEKCILETLGQAMSVGFRSMRLSYEIVM